MPRRNDRARKRHRGPSSVALLTSLGYVEKRAQKRARRAGVLAGRPDYSRSATWTS